MDFKLDCRHYLGEKPCKFKRLCIDCPHYDPMGIRICIIKLGAMGDALRTTPVLTALHRQFKCCHITWITDRISFPILRQNPEIDRLLLLEASDMSLVLGQRFDLLLSLDKALPAIAFAMQVPALARRGYAMSPNGTLDIFNDASMYSLAMGLDDDLKFNHNTKTYQQTIYEVSELEYRNDPYVYALSDDDRRKAEDSLNERILLGRGPRIGLNVGCGDVFATKKWPDEHFRTLAELLHQRLDARIYLLGGPTEQEANRELTERLGGIAADTGSNPLAVFAGLLAAMDVVVTSDTMALHLALAVNSRVIGLFGPTCHQEIDFYNRGKALVAKDDCAPCYRKLCVRPVSCMHSILPSTVADAVCELLMKGANR